MQPKNEIKDLRTTIRISYNYMGGFVFGGIDALTTGLPIMTTAYKTGFEFLRHKIRKRAGTRNTFQKPSFKNEYLRYVTGAAIPFAIRYHQEIIDFAYKTIDAITQ